MRPTAWSVLQQFTKMVLPKELLQRATIHEQARITSVANVNQQEEALGYDRAALRASRWL
jgi:hypothetical protein